MGSAARCARELTVRLQPPVTALDEGRRAKREHAQQYVPPTTSRTELKWKSGAGAGAGDALYPSSASGSLSLSLSLPSFPTLLIRSPPIPSTRPLALWLSRYGSLPSFPPSSSVSFSCPSHPSATSSHSPPLPRFVRLVSPRRPLSSCVCSHSFPLHFSPTTSDCTSSLALSFLSAPLSLFLSFSPNSTYLAQTQRH